MIEVRVDLDDRSYPIRIGRGLLDQPAQYAELVRGRQVAIVTNTTVGPIYGERVARALQASAREVITIALPDGEQYKDWQHLDLIFDALLAARFDRKCVLVALGGGVVGDMTGFAAACYQRGVDFIQVPTTLLAQVDSSVGGKTAVNHPRGKNMIGAFYQPKLVLADMDSLASLPARELAAGLAEVIKYGAIADAAFFNWIEANMPALLALDADAMAYAVQRSCALKAQVVGADEREGGIRAILNFGHTFGHAIEGGQGYGAWLHGEAVGCGMVMATDLSVRLGYVPADLIARITRVVAAAGLPVVGPAMPIETYLDWMAVDKKAEGGKTRFVLLKKLGEACVEPVPADLLEQTLRATVAQA